MPINLLLKCHDIETTKSFYSEILGFEVTDSEEATCMVQKEDCTIIFTSEDLWSGYPKCTGTIYMFIDDVDSYYESIKEKAIILWPLQDMPYGTREFGIKDYDEYHLAFAKKNVKLFNQNFEFLGYLMSSKETASSFTGGFFIKDIN